ncbi:MAG: hypothetical protein IIZ40_04365 [Bacilli bacterium]|nr:hypothetical protein [Bacilli bacterium]
MSKKVKKEKKRMSNRKKLILCVTTVLVILVLFFGYNKFIKKDNSASKPKVVDEIKSFNYVVNENDTKLFKKTFTELKEELSKKEVDNKKYAELVAKLFVIDFFNLGNKTSKNDIGGVQFVYNSYQTDFVDYARDGMYKQVGNNIYGDIKQNLPTVKSVNVSNIEEVDPTSIFGSDVYNQGENSKGYEITLDWTYDNSNGFQDKATLTIVTDGEKLSVAKMEE